MMNILQATTAFFKAFLVERTSLAAENMVLRNQLTRMPQHHSQSDHAGSGPRHKWQRLMELTGAEIAAHPCRYLHSQIQPANCTSPPVQSCQPDCK